MFDFFEEINKVSELHYYQNEIYNRITNRLFGGRYRGNSLEELPFIPVSFFKEKDLKSVRPEEVFKILSSSGTTGNPSRIFLSRENARNQTRALAKLFQEQFGKVRVPMIFFDSEEQLRSTKSFNARRAAVIGFSSFASDRFFALKENNYIDWEGLDHFLRKYPDSQVILFGFTFLLWTHLVLNGGPFPNFKSGKVTVLHGGGWKKLEKLSISKSKFRDEIKKVTGANRVIDYYGMAEQAGSIFFECEFGYFHSTRYSTILTRDAYSLMPISFGEKGIVQLISTLPISYPGHSILTQDLGTIYGQDDCHCGRMGKYFTVDSRLPTAQVRGCSDVGF